MPSMGLSCTCQPSRAGAIVRDCSGTQEASAFMDPKNTRSRRDFVKTTGGAAVGASLLGVGPAMAAQAPSAGGKKIRYALVGTGDRGTSLWGQRVARDYGDLVEIVGLCDINPKRVEYARTLIGASCPTFT